MYRSLALAAVFACLSGAAFAHEEGSHVSPMIEIDQSFGELLSNRFILVSVDEHGIAWLHNQTGDVVRCVLHGDMTKEIISQCAQVGS